MNHLKELGIKLSFFICENYRLARNEKLIYNKSTLAKEKKYAYSTISLFRKNCRKRIH